jgi:hypothetical protein
MFNLFLMIKIEKNIRVETINGVTLYTLKVYFCGMLIFLKQVY